MTLKISPLSGFVKQAKRLAKKYRQLAKDLKLLEKELLANPEAGIEILPSCFKIRLVNSSTRVGKSGGFRVIYYYLDENNHIYLLSIYSKTEQGTISEAILKELIKEVII